MLLVIRHVCPKAGRAAERGERGWRKASRESQQMEQKRTDSGHVQAAREVTQMPQILQEKNRC